MDISSQEQEMAYEQCGLDGVHGPHEYLGGTKVAHRIVKCQGRAKPYRRLSTIAWMIRSDIRHTLQELHSEALEMRASMVHGELNADGTVQDVDRVPASLRKIRRQLADGHDIPDETMERES
jgi:hypothetical protein